MFISVLENIVIFWQIQPMELFMKSQQSFRNACCKTSCSALLFITLGIRDAGNERIDDSLQKQATFFRGQGDLCLESAVLDKLAPAVHLQTGR